MLAQLCSNTWPAGSSNILCQCHSVPPKALYSNMHEDDSTPGAQLASSALHTISITNNIDDIPSNMHPCHLRVSSRTEARLARCKFISMCRCCWIVCHLEVAYHGLLECLLENSEFLVWGGGCASASSFQLHGSCQPKQARSRLRLAGHERHVQYPAQLSTLRTRRKSVPECSACLQTHVNDVFYLLVVLWMWSAFDPGQLV